MNPRFRPLRIVPLLAALALLPGCEDLVVDAGGRQVSGLTITAAGSPLVTVSGGSVTGGVTVARGASRTLVVTLQGPSGPLVPTLNESVRVSVTNPGVASWQDDGSGTGVLRGESTGATTLRVDLIRSGSAAYTSPSIPVTVT
jgi:hypothetical protein